MVLVILKTYTQLFQGGELSSCITTHLFPTLIGPLNLIDEEIFALSLQILQIVIEKYHGNNKEVVEIVATEYFSLAFLGEESNGPEAIKVCRIKDHLRPFLNKFKTIEFFNICLYSKPEILMKCFLNYDMDVWCMSMVQMSIELINAFLETDWHRLDGNRLIGFSLTDRDLALKVICLEALETLLNTIKEWFKDTEQRDKLECSLYMKESTKKKALVNCVHAFNVRPQLGIEMAIKSGFIECDSPTSLAKWLRFTRGIDKRVLGEYLGSVDRAELLQAYVNTFDFEGLSFTSSLRLFLESFRIPGESQVIERFLERFSERLVAIATDSHEFADSEVLFQVSYSTLMLNTDMYSSSVRDKMTKEGFVKNTYGAIAEDKRPSEEVLVNIYDEISSCEIQLQRSVVDHPLPLGSRPLPSLQSVDPGRYSGAILMAVSDEWAKAISVALNKLQLVPSSITLEKYSKRFIDHRGLLESTLSIFSDHIDLCCQWGLEKELDASLERLLETGPFQSSYPSQKGEGIGDGFPAKGALAWLYEVCDKNGSNLGTSCWEKILRCLSQWDLASLVDENHNFRELNLLKLDGKGFLSFASALFNLATSSNSRQRAFLTHYADRLYQVPASVLERVIRYSYEKGNNVHLDSNTESFFALLARASDLTILSTAAFGILQRVAREQMPLILSINNEAAMNGFLPALEKFGLQADLSIAKEAIETFVMIGELIFSQHAAGKAASLMIVEDQEFFLKWYHILSGLSRIALDQKAVEASRLAMQSLFKLLSEHGSCYQEGAWRVVWRSIILPLLEEKVGGDSDAEIVSKLMGWVVDLVTLHGQILISSALPDIFDSTRSTLYLGILMLLDVMKQLEGMAAEISRDNLCEDALLLLQRFITENHGRRFTSRHWIMALESLNRIYDYFVPLQELDDFVDATEKEKYASKPHQGSKSSSPKSNKDSPPLEEVNHPYEGKAELSMSSVFPQRESEYGKANLEVELQSERGIHLNQLAKQCTLQLRLLVCLRELTTKSASPEQSILAQTSTIPLPALKSLLHLILRLYEFAEKFNGNLALRSTMVKHKLAENIELLVLNHQEYGSLSLLIDILHSIHLQSIKGIVPLSCLAEVSVEMSQTYYDVSKVALQRFLLLRQPNQLCRRIGRSWVEMASRILRQWRLINDIFANYPTMNQEDPRRQLILGGEKMSEMQISIALELCLLDHSSSVSSAAKEFILAVTSRLTSHRINHL